MHIRIPYQRGACVRASECCVQCIPFAAQTRPRRQPLAVTRLYSHIRTAMYTRIFCFPLFLFLSFYVPTRVCTCLALLQHARSFRSSARCVECFSEHARARSRFFPFYFALSRARDFRARWDARRKGEGKQSGRRGGIPSY